MTTEEVKQQLDFLSEKIDLINGNLQFNITTFLAVLAIAITITGVALVLLVKNIVNKSVNKELIKMREDVKNELRIELKEYIKINQQFKVATGTAFIMDDSNEIVIPGLVTNAKEFSELPWNLKVMDAENTNVEFSYDYTFRDRTLRVTLKNYTKKINRVVKWQLIWLNEEMFK